MFYRARVPDLDGTRHGNCRIVGVGAIKPSIYDDAAVQVDERLAFRAFPAGKAGARLLVVLGDAAIADWVEAAGVHGDTLPRFGRQISFDFADLPSQWRSRNRG